MGIISFGIFVAIVLNFTMAIYAALSENFGAFSGFLIATLCFYFGLLARG